MQSGSPRPTRPSRSSAPHRIAVIASRFNSSVTEELVRGALACLAQSGTNLRSSDVVWVPGAFELPYAAEMTIRSRRVDAVVCLGAVIRGETPHFEFVASECARGIQDVMLRTRVPVAFGVLTTNTLAQAKDRAGGSMGNKGWDAASTALEMIRTFRPKRRKRG